MSVLVTQSCPTLCDPIDCGPPGSSVHGVLQARILQWVAILFSWRWNSHLLCLLQWQVGSLPVVALGKPTCVYMWLPRWLSAKRICLRPLGWEDFLEEGIATYSSILAWRIPWAEEPGRLQPMGSLRVGHDWATSLSLFTFIHWRRQWQPTTVFLPGESQGRGSLVGCRLWGRTESDTTEVT